MRDIELLAQTLKNGDFPLLQSKTFSIGSSDLDQTALQQGYCVITEETNQTLFNSIKEFCLSCKNNEIANINVRASIDYIANTVPEIYFGAGYFDYQEPQSHNVYGGAEVNHCQVSWTWLVHENSVESHGNLGIGYREVDNGSDIDEYCYIYATGNVFDSTTSQMLIDSLSTTPAVFTIYYYASNIEQSAPTVDPVLNNNDWATIRQVCEAGEASNYWAVGDTKTDVGTDGNTRTFRIVDMQGLYGKHVVFEQVETEPQIYAINSSSSNNDYSTSQMRITHLPAIMQLYSSELQESLTNTTYKVAENGNSSTVLSLTDKLFLAAGKELWVSPNSSYFRDEENAALTTYQYYAANTASSYKIKQRMNTTDVDAWFLRSPCKGNTVFATYVRSEGTSAVIDTTGSGGTTPCFSF